MKKIIEIYFTLRVVTGSIILIHGLLRIIFINSYLEFVLQNFSELLTVDTLLLIGVVLFPFLEFFTGLLIIMNVHLKRSLAVGFLISLIMVSFIVMGSLYPRLIYHTVVLALLFLLTDKQNELKASRLIE